MDMSLFDRLVGRPLASAEEPVQRVKVPKGVAVSGLDALGSVASSPEAALTVLIPAGTRSFDMYCRSRSKTREERTASSSRSWLLRGGLNSFFITTRAVLQIRLLFGRRKTCRDRRSPLATISAIGRERCEKE
jgi:hypothetical protein